MLDGIRGISMAEQSYGEKAVGLSFNPSGNDFVQAVKESYAQIIDNLDGIRRDSEDPEQKRLCSIAITEAQTAQMWAVKAATWGMSK
jgi:hypothetical protein